MTRSNERVKKSTSFNLTARLLHWLMALMVLTMLFIGAGMMTSLDYRLWLVDLHRPLGIAILALAGLRLINKTRNAPPHYLPLFHDGR